MSDKERRLQNRQVLFIAPMFFGYEKLIKQELEDQGASVEYYNDRPGNDFWTKALIRLDRRLLARKTDAYYRSLIESTRSKKYDDVLIVRGEAISPSLLRLLRQTQPKARFSLYLWDSMAYNPNARKILEEFDRKFSFDRADVEKNTTMEFLPLFYGHEFARAADRRAEPLYDACFIGTIHTDRYKVLEKILGDLEAKGLKTFVFCFYPSKILYRLRALFDPGFGRFGKKYVRFKGMRLAEVVDRISESRSVIDVNRPDQLGLTMRTIEAVGAQRKLITTNADVSKYDVYRSDAILLVDRENPVVAQEFLTREGLPFSPDVRSRYSVTSWVNRIFQ